MAKDTSIQIKLQINFHECKGCWRNCVCTLCVCAVGCTGGLCTGKEVFPTTLYKAKSQHQSDETLGSVRSTFFLKTFILFMITLCVVGRISMGRKCVCACMPVCGDPRKTFQSWVSPSTRNSEDGTQSHEVFRGSSFPLALKQPSELWKPFQFFYSIRLQICHWAGLILDPFL